MKLLGLLFILVSCAPKADKVYEYANGGGSTTDRPSKWKGGQDAFPLKLHVAQNFSEDEKISVGDAANAWEEGNNHFDFFVIDSDTPEKNSSNMDNFNDGILGVYKTDEWNDDLPATALAVTQVLGNKKGDYIEIYHADILVNTKFFSFSTNFTNGYDLQTVVLHEMGHFLGLYHTKTSTEESVMYPSIGRFTVNREPKPADNKAISSKYKLSGLVEPEFQRNAMSVENQSDEENESEGESVVIIHELHSNGTCKHYENGKLTSSH